jgi:hypothetical protein
MTLNLFYQEPDPDRWVPFDRYPRRIIRRIVRGAPRPGGQKMVFLNLLKGLDRIGVSYRVNDFGYAQRHPEELACVVGKPHLLFEREWENPILFGASVFSHPIDYPDLLERTTVQHVLVPGPWMEEMFRPYYGGSVSAWPVGIDTERWAPSPDPKGTDIMLYVKTLWNKGERERDLVGPIHDILACRGLSVREIRYGSYQPDDLADVLRRCRAGVFLCEHETQGIAYQEMLSAGVPLLAWDREGEWLDPEYFPDRVRFGPTSSVPYWDERCGVRFPDLDAFGPALDRFWDGVEGGRFAPRDFILENLTLEACAQDYVDIARSIA